jgi:transposase
MIVQVVSVIVCFPRPSPLTQLGLLRQANLVTTPSRKWYNINFDIPPRRNRTHQRAYARYLYHWRHWVENVFMRLKGWRAIATRYAKNAQSVLAAVQIRRLFLGFKIL